MRLSEEHKKILLAMAGAFFLKSHRDVDGGKEYRLHPLEGQAAAVPPDLVEYLSDNGLIDSNKKFPAATYWLTEKGKSVAAELVRPKRSE